METEKIQSLRDWVADNKSEALTAGRRVLLLEILDAALLARQKAADRLARHRGAQSPAKAPKTSQKRPGRPKKGFLASVPPIPAEVQALVAKMEGSPTDAPNPVFAMLKSKLPSSVKHDPAATQFKTAKPKK
jgi:hypothetical protein